jgi:hypothetical protein
MGMISNDGPLWRWCVGPGRDEHSKVLMAVLDELAAQNLSAERRRELREEELTKLQEMGVLEQIEKTPRVEILCPRLVDTGEPAVLTADLKCREHFQKVFGGEASDNHRRVSLSYDQNKHRDDLEASENHQRVSMSYD